MQTESIKKQAYRLLDTLPDSATWEDLMYRIYVRQAIEAGLILFRCQILNNCPMKSYQALNYAL